MTEQEKLTAVMNRIQLLDPEFKESYLSVMVIIGYLCSLQKEGLIESIYSMNEIGIKIFNITEELGWKPSDEQLISFINEMIEENDRIPILYMTRQYRDRKNEFLEEIKNLKETNNL